MDLEGVSYIDISPEINKDLGVFPGDTRFQRTKSLDTNQGDNITLSSVTTTLHLGAHTDAPNHYASGGEGISERSLDYYLGPCQVIDVSDKVSRGGMIVTQDIEGVQIETSRVLFKTLTFQPYDWNNDFCYISASLMKELVSQGVKLVGIDTPSIDSCDSKSLDSHQIVNENNMAILEGIDLTAADQGLYQLIALPLKIKEGDASPVRAVLIPKEY